MTREFFGKILFLLFALAHFFSLELFGQSQTDISFIHLTVENGLSHNGIRSIMQDSRGFLWFGTRDGLNRYDSRSFEVYRNIEQDGTSISSGLDVYALYSDRAGRLWAGTSKGLNRYIPQNNSFVRYLHTEKDLTSISNNEVKAITDDSKGNLWVGTEKGLNRLDPSTGKFDRFYKQTANKAGIAGNHVQAIYADRKGNIWVGTSEGLTMMSNHNRKYSFKNISLKPNDLDITTITQDDKGLLWIGTHSGGFFSLYPPTGEIKSYTANSSPNSLVSNIIRKILYDGTDRLWIGTLKGISIYNLKTGKYQNYRYDPNNPSSVNHNSIYDIYKDRAGSIWVATFYGGVSVYHPNTTPFQMFRYSSTANSISGNVISQIKEDSVHNLWIGTEGEGLNYYDRVNGKFINYRSGSAERGTISSNLIKAISIDHEGKVWVGSHDGGLDYFDKKTGKFVHYAPNPNNPFLRNIYSLLHDSQGRFWAGTLNKGLYLYDNDKKAFRSLMRNNEKPHLNETNITSLFEDSRGAVWVSTNKGLYLLAKKTENFKHLNGAYGLKIDRDNVNFVQEDHRKRIWIGTYDKGLILYDQRNKKQQAIYTEKNGLPSNNVLGLLEDSSGTFWISTNNGLSRYDGRSFINYSTEDGLPGNVFNINSYLKDSKGQMYFGTYSGLVSFLPKDIKQNNYRPDVYFTGLSLFGEQVAINDNSRLLKQSISTTKALTFAYDQNVFTIDFALLNYTKSDKNTYAYKLEGFDRNWNYVKSPSASYSNLPSGNYTLFVKAANNDGVWINKPISMSITINPPFWKTWWAYLLYLVLFLTAMLFIIRFFSEREKLKAELYYEHLNSEAIKELYQSKMDFFTRISHEIRTPLTLITAPVESIVESSDNADLVKRNINIVKRSTDRLLKLINELLDFRKLESGEEDLYYTQVEANDFCRKIYDSFTQMAEEQKVDFRFVPSKDKLFVAIDEDQLEKVLYNLLTNSFKNVHKNGEVTLSVAEDRENFTIEVQDNGVGIAEENLDKIFTNFFQVKNEKSEKKGWGIGLPLVKAIVEKHQGKIDIKSKQENSNESGFTNFKLIFPKKAINRDVQKSVEMIEKVKVQSSATQMVKPIISAVNSNNDQQYSILLVEDNDELRAFIKDSLTDKYRIIESINGKEGLDMATTEVPDMIISDVDMPLINGFEFAKQIKTNEVTSHIPIIMLTAFTTEENRVAGLESGVEIYLTKPFNLKVLKLSIDNMVNSIHSIRSKYSKQILLMPKKVEIQSMDEKFLDKCMQLIEENLNDQNFNVSVLVDKIGMSQAVLYKKLKALTGLNITDFIKSIRLKRAAQLLEENKLSIADIAYLVGFNDRKYFSKEFKKQYGVSPKAYIEINLA
nr:hybrid sensor histidine kinase/response regulator transcription factor [uncultured Pedobacter sp.]